MNFVVIYVIRSYLVTKVVSKVLKKPENIMWNSFKHSRERRHHIKLFKCRRSLFALKQCVSDLSSCFRSEQHAATQMLMVLWSAQSNLVLYIFSSGFHSNGALAATSGSFVGICEQLSMPFSRCCLAYFVVEDITR